MLLRSFCLGCLFDLMFWLLVFGGYFVLLLVVGLLCVNGAAFFLFC